MGGPAPCVPYGDAVELSTHTALRYMRHAYGQMLAVADRLGDVAVNQRPLGPDTNAVAALIVHCSGVAEFWLGHVGLGRPSTRDRDGEFSRTATVAELRVAVDASLRQIELDLAAIQAGAASNHGEGRQLLLDGDDSDASLVLHVIEELYQHLGHAELAADALLRS